MQGICTTALTGASQGFAIKRNLGFTSMFTLLVNPLGKTGQKRFITESTNNSAYGVSGWDAGFKFSILA